MSYTFWLPYTVRCSHINYAGHVGNAAVLDFFQDARIGYLQQLGCSELDVGDGCGLILPEAQVSYKAQMFLQDELYIGVRVASLSRTGFSMAYTVLRGSTETAAGQTDLLCFDYQAQRLRRLPAALKQGMLALEPHLAEP